MAIYRGEGGATDVEAAPGNTEFAGGIIVEKDAVVKGNLTVNGEIYGDGSNLTNIPSVEDTYTKDEIDASQEAQDTVINTKLGDAPVDGIMYGRKDSTWQTLPVGENVYTKAEIDAQQAAQDANIIANTDGIANLNEETYDKFEIDEQQSAQDVKIQANTDAIAALPTPVDTYTKAEIDASQSAQDSNISTNAGNISNNTSAIGDLSGRVLKNEEDIEVLNEGMFFASTYEARYPASANRPPADGDLYLQKGMAFTYSYSEVNLIYVSKTDQMGNVRPYTALRVGDKLILNQGDGSPNFGRYTVTAIDKQTDYVIITVNYVVGQGSVINGDTVGLQGFPASSSGGGGGIPEAPIDGKQYGRQDATWTEVTGGGSTTPTETYVGALTEPKLLPSTSETDYRVVPFTGDGWVDGKFTADTKGSYALNVGLSWSLINPIADQTFRRCVLFVNNAIVSTKSHGVDEMYPHGSKNESNWVVDLEAGDEVEVRALQQNAQGTDQNVANNKETYVRIAMLGGSGTGGGSYTPEPLVWENVTADRVTDATYTNNYDVPLYVQIDTTKGASGANFAFEIDGNRMGKIGTEDSQSSLFIVPAKATYKLIKMVADGTIENWNEAKMPLAIGSGGGTAEPMVWENKTNVANTVYTNTNDVPLYVQFAVYSPSGDENNLVDFKIDDVVVGAVGSVGVSNWNNPLYIVPAGSTYEVVSEQLATVDKWREAKMPVAIGTGGSGTPSSFARIVDRKPATEAGGASVAGTQSRTLNTVEYDNDNIVTLDGNDVSFTLQAGTYVINYSAPANRVGAHNVSLYDLTDNQTVNTGTINYSLDNASNTSYGNYSVTLTEPHSYKVSHYTEEARAGSGLGNLNPVNAGIFTTVDIQKVGTGGSGSGDYTPEALVWEDKKLENDFDVLYTNDSDVPRYVEISLTCLEDTEYAYANFLIDGKYHASMGKRGSGQRDMCFGSFIVPAGSTYNLEKDGNVVIGTWWEARMPVAVGSGDSLWSEEDGAITTTDDVNIRASLSVSGVTNTNQLFAYKLNLQQYYGDDNNYIKIADGDKAQMEFRCCFDGFKFTTDNQHDALDISKTGDATFLRDMTVNGIRVGMGGGAYAIPENTVLGVDVLAANVSGSGNTGIGSNALRFNTSGASNTAVGLNAVNKDNGGRNTGVGSNALGACTGTGNTSIGESAGSATITGNNNTLLGSGAQPSSADVSNEVTIGNGSVTKTRLNGLVTATYDNSEAQSNTAEPKQTLALTNPNGDDGTGDNNYTSLGFNVASGATSQGFITYARGGDHVGKFLFSQRTGGSSYDTQMIIQGDGAVLMPKMTTTVQPSNVYIDGKGQLYKSTTSLYSAEEVDKKLAIKDKLIEKLSARLDELEKKVK